MDARLWQSPEAAAAAAEAAEEDAGGGAGGPSRRPPRRGLHRASPYGLGTRRWLPKLPVASRIFPSVSRDHTASDNDQMDQCEPIEATQESESAEPNTNSTANAVESLGMYINPNDDSVLAKIEKIIKQKHFSRDETERLIEIMRSRTPDLYDEDQIAPKSSAKVVDATPFRNKLLTPAKPVDLQSTQGTDVFTQSNVHDVTSSPIELAKAYMEAQTSATVHESQKRKFRALSHGVDIENSASKIFPKVAVDSPVRWPGSVVRDYPHYLTPQSNKGRTLPPASSRSPYTGSVFRRSVKKTGHLDTYNNSSGRSQISTPFPVGSKAMMEDKMASTGGILGMQPSTSSERAYAETVGTTTFFPSDGSAAMKNLAFSLEGYHGKGTIGSGSTLGRMSEVDNISKRAAVSVHPKSSQTAHKILQHLERTIPSPTTKPLELRQTAKRTGPSVVISSQYKVPDSITSNGLRQSSINECGSGYQAVSDAKKVQEPPSSSKRGESPLKIHSYRANTEIGEITSSRDPPKTDLAPAPAPVVLDKSANNGFMFTFPVTKTSVSPPEPPPTPSFSSPPDRSLPADIQDIPKFTFGSSSSTDRLIFSVDSASGSAIADETVPIFKFGSDRKRELSFDVAGKDAVCF
ncbi:uncharacterized protein LOC100837239 isoform X2 [Brachypodium distachyon]|uniref:Uncharacterized protein n=1 Tax=Brachypodium distachyon TaxID=15368 RepID=I1GXH0_BRADI|nr:uncharacterized protein LOC100837239 isoform X2 [Brachypodium distachyon]KQK17743.1 hypothetical protein BRADI_1g36467v3 [Brachypodium distachyon]|eukprot:XP_010227539.1 uncharacterized protein LOC100837239 isoform X2 [Brachypodium distachyon]